MDASAERSPPRLAAVTSPPLPIGATLDAKPPARRRIGPWLERRLRNLALLMRLDRPIGIWLLLWPTLWALWIASAGHPRRRLLGIFLAGTVLMRSAGCIINDLADRNIDPHVKRTRMRPIAFRVVAPNE